MNKMQMSPDNDRMSRSSNITWLSMLVVLVALVETIALVFIFKRRAFNLTSTVVWVMPVLFLFPGLQGIRTYWHVKSFTAKTLGNEDVPEDIQRSIFTMVAFSYVALILPLVLLADYVKRLAMP